MAARPTHPVLVPESVPENPRRWRAAGAKLLSEDASSTLEWVLLLAAVALPSYFLWYGSTTLGRHGWMDVLTGLYSMMVSINNLPFP